MRVKICGITNLEDAMLATEMGAWALGFNFYSQSPRYIPPELAAEIIQKLPSAILTVGIFVNAPVEEVLAIQQKTQIQILQLHGDESIEFCRKFSTPVIKVFRPKDENDDQSIDDFAECYSLLIDAYSKNQYGGTQKIACWSVAKKIVARNFLVILAGGLTPVNVAAAIAEVNPMAVDVCSGIEEFPGKKSRQKLIAFFKALHDRRGH